MLLALPGKVSFSEAQWSKLNLVSQRLDILTNKHNTFLGQMLKLIQSIFHPFKYYPLLKPDLMGPAKKFKISLNKNFLWTDTQKKLCMGFMSKPEL